MPGRLGIDFGTSNTVVAVWDEAGKEGVPLHIPDYGRLLHYRRGDHKAEDISLIPSLIHYAADNRRWLGNQVLSQNLAHSERTFRWMKRYIANRSPIKVRLDGRELSHFDAGRDFLAAVLASAAAEIDLIDEPSAAALGYGANLQPGQVYLIFDFGGGTLDVAMVLIEETAAQAEEPGRRCRVLGKAGADVGGVSVDQWLFPEVLQRCGRHDTDEDVRRVSRLVLRECEQAKERLST